MAQKVGKGRRASGGGGSSKQGSGGGKARPGPRQPAGRKKGSAGPVKTGPRGFGGKSQSAAAAKPGAGGKGRGSTRRAAGPETKSGGRAGRRDAGQGTARGEEFRPARRGPESKTTGYAGRRGAGQGAARGEEFRPARRGPESKTTGYADRRGAGQGTARGEEYRPARRGPESKTRGYAGRSGAGPQGRAEGARPERRSPEAVPETRGTGHKGFHELDWRHPDLEGKVVGLNPVLELLKSGTRAVDCVYIDNSKGGKLFQEIIHAARGLGINVKLVPKQALDTMSAAMRHQGVVAVVAPKEYSDPFELVDHALARGAYPLFVLLDGVEDPQNLGSVIRTAEAAGADGVFIPEHRAAHLSASVARASAGALEHVSVAKVKNMATFITSLKEKGVWVVGVEAGSPRTYTQFNMDVPVAVVLGSEGAGVRPVVRNVCDTVVSLPMLGKVNSLNVSVAAGIVLYEVLRQRKKNTLDETG